MCSLLHFLGVTAGRTFVLAMIVARWIFQVMSQSVVGLFHRCERDTKAGEQKPGNNACVGRDGGKRSLT